MLVNHQPIIMSKIFKYSDLVKFPTYGDRLNYLSLKDYDYNSPRDISNQFYKSKAWQQLREYVISRDLACDLGVPGMLIEGPIFCHHMNPLTKHDLENITKKCLDPENIICVSEVTHNKIHYDLKQEEFIERKRGDTKLW